MNTTDPHKPRILISYFFGNDTIPLGASCAAGFRELGWDVFCFNSQAESRITLYFLKYVNKLIHAIGFKSADITKNSRWGNHNFRQAQLERAVTSFRPDVLLVIRGNSFDADTIRRLKTQYNIRKTVGWWVKNPRTTSEMTDDAKMYDHYFCIHQFGYCPEDNIYRLTALAVDRNLYHPPAGDKIYHHDVVFVGGYSSRRHEMLSKLSDLPVAIYGPGWRKWRNRSSLQKKVKASQIWGEALNDLYGTAKIVLNVSSWDPQHTGLNLRVFDVPATGAFLLTDSAGEIDQYFTPGTEIETFSTPDELRKKVIFFLDHNKERECIAKNGYQKVSSFESYTDKMRTLLEAIGEPVNIG